MAASSRLTVFIDPFSHHFYRDELFNPLSRQNRDQILKPYVYLRERLESLGIKTHTADFLFKDERLSRLNLYFSLGIWGNYHRVARRGDTILSGFFAVEAPINDPRMYRKLPSLGTVFRRLYSYSDEVSLRPFVGGRPLKLEKFLFPQPFAEPLEEHWKNTNRRPLLLMNANKSARIKTQELYTERLRALEFFAHNGGIDLYGFGWNRHPYPVGFGRVTGRLMDIGLTAWERVTGQWRRRYGQTIVSTYRGVAESKYATLASYRFAICFENMVLPGWVTEKIFDCFYCGTIPIYLGAPDIEQYVPSECFIDMRRFASYQDLAVFLKSLGERDIHAYRENARDYLKSEAFRPFRKETFTEHFIRAVEQDAGLRV